MKSVIRWAINNSPAMNTALITLLLVGAASMVMMRREYFPEFELEILLVTVPYPGASPEEVEEGICQKIEEAVQSIDGIKKQTAVAQENAGFVILELQAEIDVQKVLNEVRAEIDQIPSFPELAEDPDVQQITFRFPAIRVNVLGPDRDDEQSELALRELAEEIRNDLLQLEPQSSPNPLRRMLDGLRPRARQFVISSANIMGAKNYQIDIEIPEKTLREYGLSLANVARIVRRQNIELPGGRMKTASQEMLLVGKGKKTVGTDIEDIVIVTQSGGDKLTIGDLGTVRDGFTDESVTTHINGRPARVIQVDRTSNEDLYEVVSNVEAYVAQKQSQIPDGYALETWYDQSVDVRDRMDMLTRNGITGLVLVFLVLAIFLELRLAFWVALGIPAAVLGAGFLLLYTGQTLNMLSMFAFLMALGIVVDDAIVIGENIYQHRQLGKPFVQAAIDGTYEVLPSVAASVTTTVIAFLPLMFVSGVMGKFIAVMPMAVIAMLFISLVESTFILPCHLAHQDNLLFSAISVVLYPLRFLLRVFRWLNQRAAQLTRWLIECIYIPSLRWSLGNPLSVMAAAGALLIVAMGFVSAGITPFVVFPKIDSRFVEWVITYPNGTPAHITSQAAQRAAEAIRKLNDEYVAEHGHPLVLVQHRMVGHVMQQSSANPNGTSSGSHLGSITVEMTSPEERQWTSQQVLDLWRAEVGVFPGAESVVFRSQNFGPGGIPIEFKLLANPGAEDQLEPAAEFCKQQLAEYAGVYDIDDDSKPGKWELQLQIRDQAKAMSMTLADLAETVRGSYYGEEVMRLQRGRHEVKLMVRYPPEERESLAGFEAIRVRGQDMRERPVTELAEIDYRRGISEINRINQLRSITVMADVNESVANARNIVQDLQTSGFVDELNEKYPGVRIRWEGQEEQTQESMQSLFVGFVVALMAMFVLLTVEFRSYIQPLLILVIIPFGAIGAIVGHAIFQLDLTLFSVFGMVALTGVVVNDSIVLIDFINTRVRTGMPVKEALIEAGRRRFRAVMLTSITTVAGLIPLLMERSFQAQVLIPMATSLCFGLVLATVLILILVPTLYMVYAWITYRLFQRDERQEPPAVTRARSPESRPRSMPVGTSRT